MKTPHLMVGFLMWDIRRNVRVLPEFPSRFVVRFHFPDAPEKKQEHWLIFESGEVDICYIDPGYDVDVQIEANLKTMTKVWMGWQDFSAALRCGDLQIEGPRALTRSASTVGLSSVAAVRSSLWTAGSCARQQQPPRTRRRPQWLSLCGIQCPQLADFVVKKSFGAAPRKRTENTIPIVARLWIGIPLLKGQRGTRFYP